MQTIQFAWPEGAAGAVTTSWDDGSFQDRRLVALFNRHGIKGTWCLNARRLQTDAREKSVQFDELDDLYAGHEIACHAWSHPHLTRLPDGAVLAEMIEDRRVLESAAGYPVRGMSLPFGDYDSRVLRLLGQIGILHNRTVRSTDSFRMPESFLEWHPTCHHKADLGAMLDRFVADNNPSKLLYVWGHSYEFDRDDNWPHIEAFAERAGATESIWHATNMQICQYVEAWRGLWCGIDMTSLHNPSAQTLWLRSGGNLLSLTPGETVRM